MSNKTPEDRAERYADGMDPDQIKAKLAKNREKMAGRQSAATNALADMESRVKGVLSGEDISTSVYILYYNFARQVFRLQRQIGGGNGLVKEVDLLTYKWSHRGATESILDHIRIEVFGIQKES